MIIKGQDRDFYKKMVIIGIPVVFQNLISLGLNLIDTLMIGMLGEQELAAVGAANQVYFIFTVSLFGLFSGAAVYAAQYWGAGDVAGVRKMLGMDYAVGAALAVSVSVIAYLFAPGLVGLFSQDDQVIAFGTDYLRIACFSYVFSGLSMSISYNSRAIQDLRVPTIINGVALCINAVLNYLLIFGALGFPKMGVAGAAVATLIARVLEFIAMVTYVYTRKEHPLKATAKQLFGFTREHFVHVMRMAVPVLFSEGSWALSVAMIFAAYGRLGTSALAVAQVANVIAELLQSVYFGVGNATAMVIGETLGKGNKDLAYHDGKLAIRIVWILNVVMTILMVLLSRPIAGIYNFSGETKELLVITLITMAITITPKMLSYLYIVGIFRAGGDTMFCMILEIIANLGVQVTMAYFAVLVLKTSLPVAMLLVEMGNVFRILICRSRFKTRKWINIVVDVPEQ